LSVKREPIVIRGRSLGITILTTAQLLIGAIHVLFGFLLLNTEASLVQATVAYDVYTIAFGSAVLVFGTFIWQGKKVGWIGTVTVSIFVSVVDALTLLNLPNISGIPKFAAPTEIVYSVAIIFYLSLGHVRKKYLR
jgi:hypothetical protein